MIAARTTAQHLGHRISTTIAASTPVVFFQVFWGKQNGKCLSLLSCVLPVGGTFFTAVSCSLSLLKLINTEMQRESDDDRRG